MKMNLIFFFNFLWCLKRFYEDLHKTFWGTKKMYENENLINSLPSSGIGASRVNIDAYNPIFARHTLFTLL